MTGAGSFGVGYLAGWALKKMIKWVLIVVGFFAGVIFLVMTLVQKYGYVSTINWDKMGRDIYNTANSTMIAAAYKQYTKCRSLFGSLNFEWT